MELYSTCMKDTSYFATYKNVQIYPANIFSTMTFLGSLSSVNPLQCVSINSQEYKVRPEIVNVNNNKPVFFPFSIKTSKCSVVVTKLMIPMQNCVFLMLLKV